MSSSTILAPTSSSPSLQTLSLMSTSAYVRDIEADVREFWSSFPCPPPWKPQLLIEVNASRLDPHVTRTVQSFLAGKCDIRHVLSGSDIDYNLEPSDLNPGLDLRPTKSHDPGSSLGGPATSHHQWCDTTCQLSFGCAVVFVVVVLMIAVIICATRHRVSHKMAATRPSRQQLQLSTSTSDAVNCADFSNLEIQGDDDFIYPPFRHRGLPHPPSACHPSCDPKWNCPSCSSCHPLMRMSPPDLYYSRAYSAVYDTIDDDDDDAPHRTSNFNRKQSGGVTPVMSDSRDLTQSCVPCEVSPSISTVQLRQRACDDVTYNKEIAETGFNGDENQENMPRSMLPKYFELEHNCALFGHPESVTHDHNFMNSFGVNNLSGERYNFPVTTSGNNTLSYQQGVLGNSPLHSYNMDHSQRISTGADDLYKFRSFPEPSAQKYSTKTCSEEPREASGHSLFFSNRHLDDNRFDGGSFCFFGDQGRQNLEEKQNEYGPSNISQLSYNPHVCATGTSTFLSDIANQYFCHSCQQSENTAPCVNLQRLIPASQQLLTNPSFQGISVGPDLLKEASNHSRRMERDMTASSDVSDDNNEVPLRKPVLALHSQYFAKTPIA